MNRNLALILPLLLLQFPSLALEKPSSYLSQAAVDNSSCEIKAEDGDDYSDKQLQTLAKRITVRVVGDNNGGSGTLLAKKGNTYLVVTNSHVVRGVNSINLQTSDGKTYAAQIVPKTNFEKFDLALLQFQSNQNYCLPKEIAASVPDTDTSVMAAGYSFEKGQIVFRSGKVQQISSKPLKEGYEIGYSSDIEQGMSGGAILNSRGELIGINGRSAYPILNTGYAYPDGSRPTEEEIKQMRKFSWGIPISTVLALINPDILKEYHLPSPVINASIPSIKLTGWLGELEEKAKKITVRIDKGQNFSNGSGVIIAREGNTYTVLTAAHVVCGEDDKKPCIDSEYKISTSDGSSYRVDNSTIKTSGSVDLAIVKFNSNKDYEIATLADYNPNDNAYIFTAGYPNLGNNSPWKFTVGRISSKERGLLKTQEVDFIVNKRQVGWEITSEDTISQETRLRFEQLQKEQLRRYAEDRRQRSGQGGLLSFMPDVGEQTAYISKPKVVASANTLIGGYELVYTSITYGGMSGGPVLDSSGNVIGIHGRAESEKVEGSNINNGGIQTGYSLGVPISTFLELEKKFRVRSLNVSPNVFSGTPPLNLDQVNSIEQAFLSANFIPGNADDIYLLEKGNQLWRLGRYEEAVKTFDEARKVISSHTYLGYYGKGLALLSQGKDKYQDAVAAFEKAAFHNHKYSPAYLMQSVLYRELNELDKALQVINQAIEIQPKKPNLYNHKGLVLRGLKRYVEAKAALTKAIEIAPHAAFYNNRGLINEDMQRLIDADLSQQDWNEALADYTKAIELNPRFYEAYENRGTLYKKKGNYELAIQDFTDLINKFVNLLHISAPDIRWNPQTGKPFLFVDDGLINHKVTKALYNRGKVYLQKGDYTSAINDFFQVILENPENPENIDVYYHRGVAYIKQKEWNLALPDLNKFIERNSEHIDALYNRGSVYYQQKQYELALNDYNRVISLSLQNQNNYANCNQLAINCNLPLVIVNRVTELNAYLAPLYINRANIYVEQQKWNLALDEYNRIITLNPECEISINLNPLYASAYKNRALVYRERGEKQKAIPDLQKAAQLFKTQKNIAAYEAAMNLLKELQK